MKIEYLVDDNFIIYLNKHYIKDLNIEDKISVETYFKKLFRNLKSNYNLNMEGYYMVNIYSNCQYGLIIEVNKLNAEYFSLYGNKVDMKITINLNQPFLYEIDDYFIIDSLKNIINNVYFKNNKYYLELKDIIDESSYNFLLENSNIIYNDKAKDIQSLCYKI